MKRICSIYRCAKKEGMYIYVDKKTGFEGIPEALMRQMGKTELAMTLLITPEKKLARVKAIEVLAAIDAQGFYLQMPPSVYDTAESEMSQLREKNTMLSNSPLSNT
ncbi:MAG: hypothetical protein ACI9D5_000209 [Candidatus Endobugula sp.]|jgi:uncharacterized protein YcgL (UPF0745 family)